MSVDRDGRLHVAALKAIPEPPSLTDLRKRVEAMLPQVDLAEVILEMMSWEPGFTAALTSITGGRAGLAAHAMSIGFARSSAAACPCSSGTGSPRRPHLPVHGELRRGERDPD